MGSDLLIISDELSEGQDYGLLDHAPHGELAIWDSCIVNFGDSTMISNVEEFRGCEKSFIV
jgi:hypothetical protein